MRNISANGTGADNMTSGNNVFGADADRVSGGASFASLRGLGAEQHAGAAQRPPHRHPRRQRQGSRPELDPDGRDCPRRDPERRRLGHLRYRRHRRRDQLHPEDQLHRRRSVRHRPTSPKRAAAPPAAPRCWPARARSTPTATTHGQRDRRQERQPRSKQRSFANGYQPERGLSPDTTGTPFANQLTGAGTALGASFKVPGDPTATCRPTR